MSTAIISITDAGDRVAEVVRLETGGQPLARADVAARWHDFDAFVFIGALGICVRTIAPLTEDKHTDPAVVCIDTTGRHVISVLSGHVGGANDLTRLLAAALGTTPVVTTQTDNTGLWALDTLAERFGWTLREADSNHLNACIFAFTRRQPTALLLDVRDAGTDHLEQTLPDHVTLVDDLRDITAERFRLAILVSPRAYAAVPHLLTLHYVPRVLTLGIGLAHEAGPLDALYRHILCDEFAAAGLVPAALTVRDVATIDVKADEPFVHHLQDEGYPVRFFTAGQLSAVDVPTPSATVERHVGTPSVCEAAAILASGGGCLLVAKQKGANYTLAVAIERRHLRRPVAGGHVEIVGAGPGDPDLISVRGRHFLEQADLILYAGSLVPRALTECHKPGATVRSSASMNLEEQFRLMREFYDRGQLVVRLHTGDPCIYGAIQEQMALFDAHGMSYHITPGISSFQAAAAALHSQFTIPERVQTIILTRGEGRTPMPEREQLHRLAQSRSTMCIYLSAAIVERVQEELLQAYPPETPVAACYKLTWPEQRIYRGQLKDLARIVRDNHLTLTTLLVVGDAIDNREGLSRLYASEFRHLFRP